MKQDSDWVNVSTSYDPLQLYRLIEKTILAQTEDQYPFATVYDQEMALYSFRQEKMTNAQWYERFNTKVDVADAIGVSREHKVLQEFVAQETYSDSFDNLTRTQKEVVRADASERYLSYVMLRQSGKSHQMLRNDLQNDFTTGDNRYPKTRQQTLHLLDKYSKPTQQTGVQSEGTAFAQRTGKGTGRTNKKGGKGNADQEGDYDKEYWKDKKCYNCQKNGHPASHCPDGKEDNDEDKSKTSSAESVKKLTKDLKSMKKKMNTLNAQLDRLHGDDSDMSDSEDEVEETSHFQAAFQFVQSEAHFCPTIENMFKQRDARPQDLDLREVILLDNESTTDLFCNRRLAGDIRRSDDRMKLFSNGGRMTIQHKSKVPGYRPRVWFDDRAITNIMALKNVIKQYRVTYDSSKATVFIVHRQAHGKPDMYFKMHPSGLHYFDPRDESFTFVNTVADNKSQFTKRQIKRADTGSRWFRDQPI
jgi:hypothetical protein